MIPETAMVRSRVIGEMADQRFWVGDVGNHLDRSKAIDTLLEHRLVAQENQGVFALWLAGGDELALDELVGVKGEERQKKPLSVASSFVDISSLIDISGLPAELQDFSEADLAHFLTYRLGSLAFARLPIRTESLPTIPENVVSFENNRPYIQIWDPKGNPPTNAFVKEARQRGMRLMCVTSLNKSKQPEITDRGSAASFCTEFGIPLLLDSRNNDRVGSYPILKFSKNGVYLGRSGNTSVQILSRALEMQIQTDELTRSSANIIAPELPSPLDGFSGARARAAAIAVNIRGPQAATRISEILARWRDR